MNEGPIGWGMSAFLLAVIITWAFAPVSFQIIVVWAALFVALPKGLNRYRDPVVWGFWKGVTSFFLRSGFCLLIFVIIRACLTYIFSFSPHESFMQLIDPGTGGIRGVVGVMPTQLLCEILIFLIFGMTVIETAFGSRSKMASFVIGIFLLVAFASTGFSHTYPNSTGMATRHVQEPSMNAAVATNGIVGGGVRQTWRTLFGPPEVPPPPPVMILTPGTTHPFVLGPGKQTPVLRIPDDCRFNVHAKTPDGKIIRVDFLDFIIYPEGKDSFMVGHKGMKSSEPLGNFRVMPLRTTLEIVIGVYNS